MEVVAELRGRDGRTHAVRVPCRAEGGEREQLRDVRRALTELQQRVLELLAPLVQEEREAAAAKAGSGGKRGARGEEDGEEEEEGDEDEEEDGVGLSPEDPPPKRTKVQQP